MFYKTLIFYTLGMHVKLIDVKWANPVEFCLKKCLNNFICDSQQDRKTFEQICRENRVRCPDLITTRLISVN